MTGAISRGLALLGEIRGRTMRINVCTSDAVISRLIDNVVGRVIDRVSGGV